MHDLGDGTYACAWEAAVSGVYSISVMLHGEHISGSPFTAAAAVPAAEARTSAFDADADGAAALVAVAGEPAAARLRYRDAAWQPSAPEPLELKLVPAQSEKFAEKFAEECAEEVGMAEHGLTDLGVSPDPSDHAVHLAGIRVTGAAAPAPARHVSQAAASAPTRHRPNPSPPRVTAAGEYLLHAFLRGEPLSNSPIRLRVIPAPPTPAALVLPPSPLRGVAGVLTSPSSA